MLIFNADFLSYVYNPFYSSRLIKYIVRTVLSATLSYELCNTCIFLQFLLVVSLAAFAKKYVSVSNLLNPDIFFSMLGCRPQKITESLKNSVSLFSISLTIYYVQQYVATEDSNIQ